MECAKIKDLLSEYIDGTLDAQPKALIDEHLLACPKCNEELASLKTLIRELG
jgi:predicted anti-sigma-YlaC factor YlaD